MILDQLNNRLEQGWFITCLTYLDPEWQAIARDDEHVVTATGADIESAIDAANHKILTCRYIGRLFALGPRYIDDSTAEPAAVSALDLAALLGFNKPKAPPTPPIPRRF